MSVPERTLDRLRRYRDAGVPPGDFLQAVLMNNLQGAVYRADPENKAALANVVEWIELHLPLESWGNQTNYGYWLEQWREVREKERE